MKYCCSYYVFGNFRFWNSIKYLIINIKSKEGGKERGKKGGERGGERGRERGREGGTERGKKESGREKRVYNM